MGRRKDYGPSVLGGIVQRTSPSALETADPNTRWGCLRKYWYRYVLGLREPDTEATLRGKKTHSEIEKYLGGGEPSLGALAMSAWTYLPDPSPALELEHAVEPVSHFEVGGVPVLMYIDCIDPRPSFINPMGAITEESVVEVIDWKTKGNLQYALAPKDLLKTHQMPMYGDYTMRRYNVERVRLSHVYMQTKGAKRSCKTTTLADARTIERSIKNTERVVRLIVDVAKESDVNKVPPNLRICGNCYYNNKCPKSTQQTSEQIFGKAASMTLLPQQTPEVAAATAALQQAESVAPISPAFAAAVAFVQVHGYGRPAFAGEAARCYASSNGWALDPTGTYAGEGKCAAVTLENPADMERLALEVSQATGVPLTKPAAAVAPPIDILPPAAPASTPALAAEPVEGLTPAPQTPPVQPPAPATPPAETPTLNPTESVDLTDSPEMTKCLKAAASDKWGPCKKPEIAKAFTELLTRQKTHMTVEVDATDAIAQVKAEQLNIFVDCLIEGKDLAPWVDTVLAGLCQEYGCSDVRSAPQDGPLGYGKWKGAIAIMVQGRIGELPKGDYFLYTKGSELMQTVAEALRPYVRARGV